jgi:hypothetical protein
MVSLHNLNLRAEVIILIFVELLAGSLEHGRSINWIKRLEIAEDAAKGLYFINFNARVI